MALRRNPLILAVTVSDLIIRALVIADGPGSDIHRDRASAHDIIYVR